MPNYIENSIYLKGSQEDIDKLIFIEYYTLTFFNAYVIIFSQDMPRYIKYEWLTAF